MALVMSLAHWLFWRVSHSKRLSPERDIAAKRAGAKRCRGPTDDQLSVQSVVDAPSPTVTVMLVALVAATHHSGHDGNLTQQRCGSECESHS